MPRLAAPSRVGGLLLLWLAATAVLGVPVGQARVDVAPEPPLVVPGAPDDGQVRVEPPVQEARDGHLTWLLANGGRDPLTFALALHDVVTDGSRLDLGAERTDLPLDVDQLRLASGEQARIRLPVPEGTEPGAVALVARTVDADPETEVSALATMGPPATVTPSVVRGDGSAGVFTVRLAAPGAALVDVAIRASLWPGVTTDEQRIDGVVVPPGGRDLEIDIGGLTAGRMTLEVATSGSDDVGALTLWWWPWEVLLGAAALLLLAAGVVVVVRVRARRHRRRTPAPDPPPGS